MTLEPWLRFIHIGAATIWLGGGLMLAVVGLRARSSGDMTQIVSFGRTVQYVGIRVLAPSMVLLLLAGIGLVLVQSHSFTEPWILLALVGFVIAFVIGAGFVARNAIELGRVVSEPSPDPGRACQLVGRWLAGYGAIVAVLAVILWDMIFKPGL